MIEKKYNERSPLKEQINMIKNINFNLHLNDTAMIIISLVLSKQLSYSNKWLQR